MSGADAMLELSRRAWDRAGDTKTAQAARETARSLTQQITTDEESCPGCDGMFPGYIDAGAVTRSFGRLQPSGPLGVAAAMEDLVRQARQLGPVREVLPRWMSAACSRAGPRAVRLVALALMEGNLALADLPSVRKGISSSASVPSSSTTHSRSA